MLALETCVWQWWPVWGQWSRVNSVEREREREGWGRATGCSWSSFTSRLFLLLNLDNPPPSVLSLSLHRSLSLTPSVSLSVSLSAATWTGSWWRPEGGWGGWWWRSRAAAGIRPLLPPGPLSFGSAAHRCSWRCRRTHADRVSKGSVTGIICTTTNSQCISWEQLNPHSLKDHTHTHSMSHVWTTLTCKCSPVSSL